MTWISAMRTHQEKDNPGSGGQGCNATGVRKHHNVIKPPYFHRLLDFFIFYYVSYFKMSVSAPNTHAHTTFPFKLV